jgi:hypothetical protein
MAYCSHTDGWPIGNSEGKAMIYIPGDIIRFRVLPGDDRLVVIACDGVLVTVTDGRTIFDLPIGDVCR